MPKLKELIDEFATIAQSIQLEGNWTTEHQNIVDDLLTISHKDEEQALKNAIEELKNLNN